MDLIDRQTAIDALSTPHGILYPIRTIEALPSAQPERKTGHWIHHKPFDCEHHNCNTCIERSCCGTWFGADSYAQTKYCPNCGAKMEGGTDETA